MSDFSNFRAARRAHEDESHRERWLISYADLVTLLFALFVTLYAAADRKRAHAVAESIRTELSQQTTNAGRGVLPDNSKINDDAKFDATRERLERIVSQTSALKVKTDERGLIISLAEAGFFAPGDAALRADAQPLLDSLTDALRGERAPLRIEGHTDSTPISTARFASNWDLSTARASAVLARFIAKGFPAARISLAGYGDQRPVGDNSTEEGRALNRRVEIVVLKSAQ